MVRYYSYRGLGLVGAAVLGLLAARGVARAEAVGAAVSEGPGVGGGRAGAAPLLEEAYRRKARGDLDGAVASFRRAQTVGADPQRVALEIGYLASGRGALGDARSHFAQAAAGPDPGLAAQARGELEVLPSRFAADVYFDSQGWYRQSGATLATDLVPTLRVRGYFQPSLDLDLRLYLFGQATRDTASRGRDSAGVPAIYADNHALTGAGLLLRLLDRHLGLFAQAGPAFNLIDDGRPAVALDVRAGMQLGLESAGCRPERGGASLRLSLCADLYAEGVYVSRFRHNLVGFSRAHLGVGYLLTGPVSWQLLLQARSSADRNADYYNNFADGGLVQRWRVLGAVPFDITAGLNAGRYFGRAGLDPAPSQLRYLDLRVLLATYLEL